MSVDPGLFQPLLDDAEMRRVAASVRAGTHVSLAGLVESSKALVLHLLRGITGRPILLVVPDDERLDEYARDLASFSRLFGAEAAAAGGGGTGTGGTGAARRVLRFPALGPYPYQGIPPYFRTSCARVS